MRFCVVGLATGLVLVLAACGDEGPDKSQSSSPPAGDESLSDCRPGTDHVPYDVRLPTDLPYGMSLQSACVHPPAPFGSASDLKPVSFSYDNADSSAGFLLETAAVELNPDGTPIPLGDTEAYVNRHDRGDGSVNYGVQVATNGVTYIVVGTIDSGNRLTEADVERIAESIVSENEE